MPTWPRCSALGYLRRDPTKPRAIEVRYDADSATPMERRPVRHVPLVGDVAAGTDVLAQENAEETYPVPAEWTGDGPVFMLRVRGESMIDAGILPGDYVVARQQAEAAKGDLVVAGIPGEEATVKTYTRKGDKVVLLPANPRLRAHRARPVRCGHLRQGRHRDAPDLTGGAPPRRSASPVRVGGRRAAGPHPSQRPTDRDQQAEGDAHDQRVEPRRPVGAAPGRRQPAPPARRWSPGATRPESDVASAVAVAEGGEAAAAAGSGGGVVAGASVVDEVCVGASALVRLAVVGGARRGGAPLAAPTFSRPLQPAPHGTRSRAPSSRETAADGLRPWASSRATAPETWGAAIDVPAEEA